MSYWSDMRKKVEIHDNQDGSDRSEAPLPDNGEDESIKVTDRRHWMQPEDEDDSGTGAVEPARPSIIEEYRGRAEAAEQKLQEYIEAFKQFRGEQDQIRQRQSHDVDRKVDMKFGGVVGELLETVDNLDLALHHARNTPGTDALVQGIELARDRFVTALERTGVEKIEPVGEAFDPNVAEALRVDPVESSDQNDRITETLQPGYRIREYLIRPARVAVGRFTKID